MKVDFRFDLDDRVVTAFGDEGIVVMLGFDAGGPTYFVKTRTDSTWYKEKELFEKTVNCGH